MQGKRFWGGSRSLFGRHHILGQGPIFEGIRPTILATLAELDEFLKSADTRGVPPALRAQVDQLRTMRSALASMADLPATTDPSSAATFVQNVRAQMAALRPALGLLPPAGETAADESLPLGTLALIGAGAIGVWILFG